MEQIKTVVLLLNEELVKLKSYLVRGQMLSRSNWNMLISITDGIIDNSIKDTLSKKQITLADVDWVASSITGLARVYPDSLETSTDKDLDKLIDECFYIIRPAGK